LLAQTLHGYEDGHVLIAGSLEPDDQAAELMLLMSDLAPARRATAEGWLTAYPLPSMDAYVLARTWPAPEMPRPGCVWTHSLIIDYATLGSLRSFEGLVALFQRPTRDDGAAYRRPLKLTEDGSPTRLPRGAYSSAREGLLRLYGQTGPAVIPCLGTNSEAVALALWAQQWPRLRRRMRWSTTPISPSSALPEFDFVMDPALSARVGSADPVSRQGWLVGAMADLRGGGGPLRLRLREFAIDVSLGRRAFSPLAAAALLSNVSSPRPREVGRMLALMDARLPNEAVVAKASLLGTYLRSASAIDTDLLSLALRLLPDLPANETALKSIAAACLSLDPDRFWDEVEPRFPEAADQALCDAGTELLRGVVSRDAAHADRILNVRPDLAADPEFWSLSASVRQTALRIARQDKKTRKAALKVALERLDAGAALELTSDVGSAPMLDSLAEALKRRKPASGLTPGERDWIAAASQDVGGVRRHLMGGVGHNLIFTDLARRLGPMAFEAGPGEEDVWYTGWNAAKGPSDRADGEYIATFFLIRACRFEMLERPVLFGVAANMVLEAVDRGLTDPQAMRLLNDLSIRNFFNPFETRYGALVRGLATWAAIQSVPIEDFVADGRSKHVEAFLGELRYVRGGQKTISRAVKTGRALSKRRRQLLDSALF